MSAPALPGRRWPALFWVGVLSIALGCDDPPRADAEDPVADAAAASSDDAALNGETDIERDAGADALADAEDAAQPSPSSADAAVAPPPPAVRLNEIECRGDEWIELYFGGPGPVSLTGWTVSDDNDDPERTLTLDGVTIQPGTVWQSPDELPFKIGCSGDQIRLRAPDGVLVDTVSLDGPDTGLTWGRLPDGDGEWTLTEPTPGQLNAPPAPPTVRFNEIDCSGRARIELVSPEGEDVALAGWSIGVRANDDGGPGERYRLGGRLGAEVVLVPQCADSAAGQVSGEDLALVFEATERLVAERGALCQAELGRRRGGKADGPEATKYASGTVCSPSWTDWYLDA